MDDSLFLQKLSKIPSIQTKLKGKKRKRPALKTFKYEDAWKEHLEEQILLDFTAGIIDFHQKKTQEQ